MINVGVVSTFPPTQCGIATYAHDLTSALGEVAPSLRISQIRLVPSDEGNNFSFLSISSERRDDYKRASEHLNRSSIDVVDIQHEFKIFGKPDGENIEILLRGIKKPIVTTLHTVSKNLNNIRSRVFTEIVKRSDTLFVFSEQAKLDIREKYEKSETAIEVIPHGVPMVHYQPTSRYTNLKKGDDGIVFVSAGHMRNTKGYEIAINALAMLRATVNNFHYLIIGSNHPQNEAAATYRESIEALVGELNLTNHVTFINDYIPLQELVGHFQSADVCLTPYTREEQSSSGILALMLACGRPVVSTPYQFATSCIGNLSGELAASFSAIDFANAISKLIGRKRSWNRMSENNHSVGRLWSWNKVAEKYWSAYECAANALI